MLDTSAHAASRSLMPIVVAAVRNAWLATARMPTAASRSSGPHRAARRPAPAPPNVGSPSTSERLAALQELLFDLLEVAVVGGVEGPN